MTGPVALTVVGAAGRLGREILAEVVRQPDCEVVAVVVRGRSEAPLIGSPPEYMNLQSALEARPDAVVIDVSSPDRAAERIQAAATRGCPLVEATTGLDSEAESAIEAAAERVAVVVAPNLSPGIAALTRVLATILEDSGTHWEAAVLDRHHRHKRDAPSGTARVLRDVVARGLRGLPPPDIVSVRQGETFGEHTVFLSGTGEELVLTHRALDRRVFARGAVLAARFARRAEPGSYGMVDVLATGGRESAQ